MSKAADQFLANAKQPEPSIGAVEATMEGMKGAVAAFLAGAGEVWDAAKPMFDKGRTEAAAALFSGNDRGFVMYGGNDNQKDQNVAPDHGLPPIEAMKQPEVQQDQGMGM